MTETQQPVGTSPPPPAPPDGSAPAPPEPRGGRPQIAPRETVVRSSPWRLALIVGSVLALGVFVALPLFLVVISLVFMIFMHELGHFMAAKRAGMKVTEFFIGFGPRIWSFQRGETEYGVKAIPAGAYVKIIGMMDFEEVPPADEGRTYRQKSFPQRMLVAVAGSGMHFLMALVLLFALFVGFGYQDPDETNWQVAEITPGSAAAESGLEPGDRILAVDGQELTSFTDVVTTMRGLGAYGDAELTVLRDGQEQQLDITFGGSTSIYGTVGEDLRIQAPTEGATPTLLSVVEGGVVAQAGLRDGDQIDSINGQDIGSVTDVAAAVAASDGGVVAVGAVRDGSPVAASVDLGTAVETGEPTGFLGVSQERQELRYGVLEAVPHTFSTFGEIAAASISGVGRFLWPPNLLNFADRTVNTAPGEVDGNVTDAPTPATAAREQVMAEEEGRVMSLLGAGRLGSQLTEAGIQGLFEFLVMINIFIGVFNLFPSLPLDGGHVVIAVYERFQEWRRKDGRRYFVDSTRLMPVAYGVVVVLIAVGVMAFYLDLVDPISL